jgi:hypothetical protein
MVALKLVAGISLIILGVVFANPFTSGVANICTMGSDFLSYQPGCNIHWSSPTYPIFMPLFAGGIVLIGWAIRDMRTPPQIHSR